MRSFMESAGYIYFGSSGNASESGMSSVARRPKYYGLGKSKRNAKKASAVCTKMIAILEGSPDSTLYFKLLREKSANKPVIEY